MTKRTFTEQRTVEVSVEIDDKVDSLNCCRSSEEIFDADGLKTLIVRSMIGHRKFEKVMDDLLGDDRGAFQFAHQFLMDAINASERIMESLDLKNTLLPNILAANGVENSVKP